MSDAPGSHRDTSNSLSSVVSTLVPTAIIAGVYVSAFLFLRTKQHRVYSPRTFLDNLHDEQRTPKPDTLTKFNWIKGYRGLSDEYILTHQSLDAYLYVRIFKIMALICVVGCAITWPVLFPVNATGGAGMKQLDILSMANVKNMNRYYAHALVAWVFLSFVIFMITRETIYWINLRQAYMLTPRNASRISSRTVLFTSVPQDLLSEGALRQAFERVRRVWIVTDTKELEGLVADRDKTALKLEAAEVKLLKIANNNRIKTEKKAKKSGKDEAPPAEESGSASARWVPAKERPTHRLKFLIGKKVDTIEWTRTHLAEIDPQVDALQSTHREVVSSSTPLEVASKTGEKKTGLKSKIPGLGGMTGKVDVMPAVFIEFETQSAAQTAFQNKGGRLSKGALQPRCISSTPEDIIWSNMKKSKWERLIRSIIATTAVWALIIFWAIAVAFVGTLSNIDSLTEKVPFLKFINDIPPVILGVVTGLLPVVLMAILIALVPIIMRLLAKQCGFVTVSRVELKTQSWYFAFQVVDVFLITTFTSGASSVVQDILKNPPSALPLLAENLPKASNFYICYFVLFGLSAAPGLIFNLMPLLWFNLLSPILDGTPRKRYNRWLSLAGLSWGSTVPKFVLLGVIAIAYSCIAPLVLGFSAVSLFLLYLAFRYSYFYTMTTTVDTKGAFYGRALNELMAGVYLAEFCLVGIFAIRAADSKEGVGPLVLMAVFAGATVAYHLYMNYVLKPLKTSLDEDLMQEAEQNITARLAIEDGLDAPINTVTTDEAVDAEKDQATAQVKGTTKPKPISAHRNKGGIFAPWLLYGSKSGYSRIVEELKNSLLNTPVPAYSEKDAQEAYFNPAITEEKPHLWIVKDKMGISTQEVADTSKVIDITDSHANFNEKGKIEWDMENVQRAPIWESKVEY